MKTTEGLQAVMDQFYGGSEGRYRHWAHRRFIFTEGVKAVADHAGAYWLLDIVATEVAPLLIQRWESREEPIHFLRIKVECSKAATITLERDIDDPLPWRRDLQFTDFPAGEWVFKLAMDGIIAAPIDVLVMCLMQED